MARTQSDIYRTKDGALITDLKIAPIYNGIAIIEVSFKIIIEDTTYYASPRNCNTSFRHDTTTQCNCCEAFKNRGCITNSISLNNTFKYYKLSDVTTNFIISDCDIYFEKVETPITFLSEDEVKAKVDILYKEFDTKIAEYKKTLPETSIAKEIEEMQKKNFPSSDIWKDTKEESINKWFKSMLSKFVKGV